MEKLGWTLLLERPCLVLICTASHWKKWGERALEIGVGELEVNARDDWHRIYRDEARTAAGQLPGQLWQPAAPVHLCELKPWEAGPKPTPTGRLPMSMQLAFSCPAPAEDATVHWPPCWVSAQPRMIPNDTGEGHMTRASEGSVHSGEAQVIRTMWTGLAKCWQSWALAEQTPHMGRQTFLISSALPAPTQQPMALKGPMEIQVIGSQAWKVYRSFSQGKGLTS